LQFSGYKVLEDVEFWRLLNCRGYGILEDIEFLRVRVFSAWEFWWVQNSGGYRRFVGIEDLWVWNFSGYGIQRVQNPSRYEILMVRNFRACGISEVMEFQRLWEFCLWSSLKV
jgi:hypothetical protein